MSSFLHADVFTLGGKKIGKVVRIDKGYVLVQDKGVITDTEFRIPINAISSGESKSNGGRIHSIKLNIDEEQLKHGHEFTSGNPNSAIISGEASPHKTKAFEKQTIRYQAREPLKENVTPAANLSPISEYSCDMCSEKFDDPEMLQEHRVEHHKGPTGI